MQLEITRNGSRIQHRQGLTRAELSSNSVEGFSVPAATSFGESPSVEFRNHFSNNIQEAITRISVSLREQTDTVTILQKKLTQNNELLLEKEKRIRELEKISQIGKCSCCLQSKQLQIKIKDLELRVFELNNVSSLRSELKQLEESVSKHFHHRLKEMQSKVGFMEKKIYRSLEEQKKMNFILSPKKSYPHEISLNEKINMLLIKIETVLKFVEKDTKKVVQNDFFNEKAVCKVKEEPSKKVVAAIELFDQLLFQEESVLHGNAEDYSEDEFFFHPSNEKLEVDSLTTPKTYSTSTSFGKITFSDKHTPFSKQSSTTSDPNTFFDYH